MKKRSYDIALLLVVLVLFSASLGVLHGRRVVVNPSINDERIHNNMLTKQDALDYLDPLILSGNVDTMAQIMHQFSPVVFLEVLDTVINPQFRTLSNEQKVAFILANIQHDRRRGNKPMLIARLAKDFIDYPIFYDALNLYEGTIYPIQSWLKRTKNEKIAEEWRNKSLEKALAEGNLNMLALLQKHNIRPDAQQASEFLRRVVLETDHADVVSFLIQEWGADPNYSNDQKHTILIEAVEHNKPKMVQMLMRGGGQPNLILDSAIGSAKQVAFSHSYIEIERIIRDFLEH